MAIIMKGSSKMDTLVGMEGSFMGSITKLIITAGIGTREESTEKEYNFSRTVSFSKATGSTDNSNNQNESC